MHRRIAGLMLLSVLSGCAPTRPQPSITPARQQPDAWPSARSTSPRAAPVSPAGAPTATLPVAHTQLLEALNQARAHERCPPLALDARLNDVAQHHAAEIARRREVSHRSADGSTLDQRLQRHGYTARRSAELIAVGREPPAALTAAWMSEPLDGRQRREISNCLYQDLGIGMAATESGIRYWVVVLAEPAP